MPIPKPGKDESKDDFLKRCMGNEVMVQDFSDNKQRYAVCNTAWEDKDKDEKEEDANKMSYEKRIWPDNEIRVFGEGDSPKTLVGYAAVFDSLSTDLGGFREKIQKNAFKRSIESGADVRALWNHNPDYILGRTKAGTLEVSEDDKGLRVNIKPPKTQWAMDLVESVSRGDVSQMSFGFRVQQDSWERQADENIRTLLDVSLIDVSPVTFPAYADTQIQSRSLSGLNLGDVEKVLIRAEHKLTLDDKDRSIIKRAIDVFAGLEDTFKADPGKDTQEETLQHAVETVAIRRRILALRNRNY